MTELREAIAKFIKFLNNNDGTIERKVFRSGLWIVTSNIWLRMLTFARTIVLARLLTPEIFGQFGIVQMLVLGIDRFTKTSFESALIHRQETVKGAADTAWVIGFGRAILICGM